MSTNLLSNNVGMTVPIQFKSYLTDVSRNWYGSTSSSDGTVLAACVYGGTYGYIYTSTNSGVNWTVRMNDLSRNWRCITCSGDGSKMVAGVYGGQIYTSTNYGATWTARDSNRYWFSLASSSDGVNLVASSTYKNPNLQLWLDANDYSTLTFNSGNVTNWNDKSGNGYNASIFVGSATYNATGFNNLPAIQFTSGGFRALSPIGTFSNGITYFGVYKKTGAASVDSLLSKTINGGIPAPFITERRFRTYLDLNSQPYILTSVINFSFETGLTIISTTINSSTWNEYKNGVSTDSFNISSNFVDNGEYIYIGTRDNKTSYTTAVISEIIVYNRVLTTTERQNVEGYLATKWNLRSSLPVTHPYYNTASNWSQPFSDGTNGYIYTSADSGANWTVKNNDSPSNWYSVVSSSNGVNIAACAINDNVYISNNSGTNWTPTPLGSKSWSCLASSADGTKLVAGVQGGFLYTSTDSGANWTSRMTNISRQWYLLASSSDGNTIVAGIYGGQLYTSTDSGVNWITRITDINCNWSSVACSSDATTIVACDYGGYIYTLLADDTTYSQDIGTIIKPYTSGTTQTIGITSTIPQIQSPLLNFTPCNSSFSLSYNGVASSKDGSKLVAVVNNGFIYTSTDSGLNWTPRMTDISRNWISVASSSNGKKLVACDNTVSGYIYTSTDSGVYWAPRISVTNQQWFSIASSSNGTKLVACLNHTGLIYTSTDSGITWTTQSNSGYRTWQCVTSSSDGTKLAGVSYKEGTNTGYIYTSNNSGLNWTENISLGSKTWISIASSSDGNKLVALVYAGYIYTSINSGTSWTENTSLGIKNWNCVTSSADGIKLAATVGTSEYIYTSIDSGLNWIQQNKQDISANWYGIASSSDGNKLVATINGGQIYTLTPTTNNTTIDIGQIYQPYVSGFQPTNNIYVPKQDLFPLGKIYVSKGSYNFTYMTASTTGQYVCGIIGNDDLYYSTNYGDTFNRLNTGITNWKYIASSSVDVMLGITTALPGTLYRISSGGISSLSISGSNNNWSWCAISYSGTRFAVCTLSDNGSSTGNTFTGRIYLSTNSGSSWKTINPTISTYKNYTNIAIYAPTSTNIKMYVTSGDEYILSADSGTTWSSVGGYSLYTYIYPLDGSVVSSNSPPLSYSYSKQIIASSSSNRLRISDDVGINYTNIKLNCTFAIATDSYILAVLNNTLYKSSATNMTNTYDLQPFFQSILEQPPYKNGLKYIIYNGYINNNADFIKFASILTVGTTNNFTNFSTATNNFTGISYTVNWIGYFLPNSTGTHVFNVTTYSDAYIWFGTKAISGYNLYNANIFLISNDSTSYTITLTSGIYYPIRIIYSQPNNSSNGISITYNGSSIFTGKFFYC